MAQYPSQLESRLEEKQREFDLIDQVYPRALARVEGRDEEWERKKKEIQERIARSVLVYKFDDPPHKAVAIIAQVQADCRELLQSQRIVESWEEARRELLFLHQEVEKRKESTRSVEHAYAMEKEKWGRRAIG